MEKLNALGAQGVDLNLGCPAPVQKRQGAGSSLAGDRQKLSKILRAIRANTDLPFSVKIRLGQKKNDLILADFCKFLEAEGVDLITVHARLDGEKFCRKPKWYAVASAKNSVKIPVFVNGGVFSAKDAARALEESGADGIMVGRGAVIKPWLCRDIASAIYGVKSSSLLQSKHDVYSAFLFHLEERFPKERQLGSLKQFTSYYASSFTFGYHLGSTIQSCKTIEEAKEMAFSFFHSSEPSSLLLH